MPIFSACSGATNSMLMYWLSLPLRLARIWRVPSGSVRLAGGNASDVLELVYLPDVGDQDWLVRREGHAEHAPADLGIAKRGRGPACTTRITYSVPGSAEMPCVTTCARPTAGDGSSA